MITFIDNVLIRLKDLNKKQSHLIRELSINKATFSMWKHKKRTPRADVAVKIARYLNTSVEALVTSDTSITKSFDVYLKKIVECAEKMTPEKRNELANIAESLLECNSGTAMKIADLTEYLAKLEKNDTNIVRESESTYLSPCSELRAKFQGSIKSMSPQLSMQSL